MNTAPDAHNPTVECPHCHRLFALTEALTGPIESKVQQRLEVEYRRRERERAVQYQAHLEQVRVQATAKGKAAQDLLVRELQEQVTEQKATITKQQEEQLALRRQARELAAKTESLELE